MNNHQYKNVEMGMKVKEKEQFQEKALRDSMSQE